MILSCTSCNLTLRISGDEGRVRYLVGTDSSFAKNGYVCPGCGGKAVVLQEPIPNESQVTVRHLDVEEAYAALSGFGLPEERSVGVGSVYDLLVGHRVIAAELDRSPANRSVVRWISLDNGFRIYMAAGYDGAVVYKIKDLGV